MLKPPKTLAKWARLGWIVSMPLPGPGVRQHRLFDMRSVNRAPAAAAAAAAATTAIVEESMSSAPPCVVDIDTDTNNNNNRFDAIYVRVSTNEQSEELDRQLATPSTSIPMRASSGMWPVA